MTGFDPGKLSHRYVVRRLTADDVEEIYALCAGNPLFYRYHPPIATRADILADLTVLPPGKGAEDKYFVGFYEEDALIAVLDLILSYPQPDAAYVGFFMLESSSQGRGTATAIIGELADCLRAWGCKTLRLAIDEGNPQSEAFWTKNHFVKTGERRPNGGSAYLPMERRL